MTIAYLTRPADGELSSGDAVVVREEPGVTVIAVVDVLGHGPAAAQIAGQAVKHLQAAPIAGAVALMQGLHDALRGTRGAAATICVLRGGELEVCGVGNVEVRVTGSNVPVVLTPGIVGARLGLLRAAHGRLHPGDRVVCWSDGISTRWSADAVRHLTPRDACVRIMADHRRAHDDATVLIAETPAPARGRTAHDSA